MGILEKKMETTKYNRVRVYLGVMSSLVFFSRLSYWHGHQGIICALLDLLSK